MSFRGTTNNGDQWRVDSGAAQRAHHKSRWFPRRLRTTIWPIATTREAACTTMASEAGDDNAATAFEAMTAETTPPPKNATTYFWGERDRELMVNRRVERQEEIWPRERDRESTEAGEFSRERDKELMGGGEGGC
ncbi:hypothetical protein Scep_006473 [Stephania cephalantha]|uniref:Uncharacterized protein n=1 Tax=Stephania cephalantha TaxID=152367 RepID=A0AAP0PP23_9MAGN